FLYAFVVFLMRVIGRRELSTLSALDLVLLVVLGDAIQQGLTQDDYSVTGAVIAVSTIAVVQVGSSYISFRSRRARRVLEGEPIGRRSPSGSSRTASPRRERTSLSSHSSLPTGRSRTALPSASGLAPRSIAQRAISLS